MRVSRVTSAVKWTVRQPCGGSGVARGLRRLLGRNRAVGAMSLGHLRETRRRVGFTLPVTCVGWLLAFGVTTAQEAAGGQAARSPTFHADIAPILHAKCVGCHQERGDAPFALETLAQVRRRATQIVRVIHSGYMPPWKPAADSLPIVGDRRLSAAEKQLIDAWVHAGLPEGAPSATRPLVPSTEGWLWGTPDLVLTLPEYVLPPEGADVFRNFVVSVPFTGARYVRGLQFRPSNSAVHHANIRIDATRASADLDAADAEPGYAGVILRSARYPDGHFLGWTPGQAAPPDGEMAWRLAGQSWFVVQLHMRATGRPERIRAQMGLYFTDRPPSRTPAIVRLGRQDLRITPGQKEYVSTDTFVMPTAANVMAIQPHSHYRARDVRVTAELPDGSQRTVLHIDDWDFNWQDQYRLAEPLRLPAGTTLRSVYRFDNSRENPRNPSQPPAEVQWGWRSSDEMADVWLQMMTASDEDRRVLSGAAEAKATREDGVGAEVLIAREPEHFNLRNDAAAIYMELREPQKALEHFRAARRLNLSAPSAAYNVGTALELLGRREDALESYRAALTLDARYAPAHLRVGAIHYLSGNLSEAIGAYRAGLALAPGSVRARCELAKMLTEAAQPAEAVTHYQQAVGAEPTDLSCLVNFTWLLAASDRTDVRNPQLAVEMGQRALTESGDPATEALALDALAAALAAAQRFDEAVATATRALTLTRDPAHRTGVQERLSLYRRRVPFVVR